MFELISEHACFGGVQRFYRHHPKSIGLPMRFSVFFPPAAKNGPVPALIYLAGLTCTEETFVTKSGAQRKASEAGVMLISLDTSPRGANVPGESENWDLGVGAGFYVDATQAPWCTNYRMYSYVLELRQLLLDDFAVSPGAISIMGHSMGGHGALVLALRNPGMFKSVSAIAPICAPSQCPWGVKAFSTYLGTANKDWLEYDASALMAKLRRPYPAGILVDQGTSDKFLVEQLSPSSLEIACETANQPLQLRRFVGYDHGYYFISTVIDDHLMFHAEALDS
ncbi:S-formylglutathione hydrolase [Herbaspirillum camelliae]|uniref:S-formylglutathione hydrolase n=1 Tax=Herbaspirillum camelliae TaxID=1892903 RepID=UPI000949FCF6|nr:S-formylglutathione hydrolase [Herbaspirillum camelliae]